MLLEYSHEKVKEGKHSIGMCNLYKVITCNHECHSFVNSLLHYLFVEYCAKLIFFFNSCNNVLMLLQSFQACMAEGVLTIMFLQNSLSLRLIFYLNTFYYML